ncbi:MAG TPA: hypothetical protein VFQ59_00070 [Candidatus Paceibacterota bacterium]|nr:hypothetical protein [Candidatus Paceibacterota bacterium]
MKKKNHKILFKNTIFPAIILLAVFTFSGKIFAQNMQSPSYRMQTDSLNVGGFESSSPLYGLKDTLGELATGDSNSNSYFMKAGFWQMQESYISVSSPPDLTLPNIGIVQASSEGTVSWTIMTDNPAGYTTSISASTVPAMKSPSDFFTDYAPSNTDPDYDFNIAPTNSAFGISIEGTEVISRWKNNGSLCNAGTLVTPGKCWDGLSTTPKTVSGSPVSNHPNGAETTVRFKAERGPNRIQDAGVYQAVITITAIPL